MKNSHRYLNSSIRYKIPYKSIFNQKIHQTLLKSYLLKLKILIRNDRYNQNKNS